jgi:outer membrane protein OmpA-like peptidoglycan-associated protein
MSALLLGVSLGAAAAGCATKAVVPSELHSAEVALEEARRSGAAPLSRLELYDAEVALAQAKRDQRERSLLAGARAYTARRMAERAKIAALYASEREAAELAGDRSRRLRRNLERRAEAAEDRVDRTAEEASRREGARNEMLRALELARGGRGELIRDAEEIRLRLPTEVLFKNRMPVLQPRAHERLLAIAEAIRLGPPCFVWIQVLEDVDGLTMDNKLLSQRRTARIGEALMDHGVPADDFFARPERAPVSMQAGIPIGAQVDVILVERPVRVPPVAVTP